MKKTPAAMAIAAAFTSGSALAASEWTLVGLEWSRNTEASAYLLSGTLTFSNGPGNSLEADGPFSAALSVGMTPLYSWNFGADFAISGAGGVSGSFSCAEGLFGGAVGASICGNYNFGANAYNESSYDGSSGTAVIGGDDVSLGPAVSLAELDGLSPDIPPTDFQNIIVLESVNSTSTHYRWTFTANPVVPIPAAVWLFGSALGLLGWMRRTPRQ